MSVKAIVIDDTPGKTVSGIDYGKIHICPFKKGEQVHIEFMEPDFVIVLEYPTPDFIGRPSWWHKRRFREISYLTFDDLVDGYVEQDANKCASEVCYQANQCAENARY